MLAIQCYLNEEETFDIEKIKGTVAKTAKKLDLSYEESSHPHKNNVNQWYQVSFNYQDMKLYMYARDFRLNGCSRGGVLNIRREIRHAPCFVPFTDIYIDYNGNVMPCCNLRSDVPEHSDFILGNVNKASVLEIFNGEKSRLKLREILGKNNIELYPCNECTFAMEHQASARNADIAEIKTLKAERDAHAAEVQRLLHRRSKRLLYRFKSLMD